MNNYYTGKNKERYGPLLFDYQTTNRTDYRGGEIKGESPKKYTPIPAVIQKTAKATKYTHTLGDWKLNTYIPFDLFLAPKGVTDTDPRHRQKPYSKPVDEGRAEAQKTRPRLIISPAFSIDDINDLHTRNILIDYMYTTEWTDAAKEAIFPYLSVRAPFSDMPASAQVVRLPLPGFPVIPPEWREEATGSLSWDNKQLRIYVDPTKHFWLKKGPQMKDCRACIEHAAKKSARLQEAQSKPPPCKWTADAIPKPY